MIKIFNTPKEILRIIRTIEPNYLYVGLSQMLLSSIIPLLYVYFPKLIIEKLINGSEYREVLGIVILFSFVLLILRVLNVLLTRKSEFYRDLFSIKLKYTIAHQTMTMEVKDVETATTRNRIQLATNATKLVTTFGLVQKIIAKLITAIGFIFIISQLDSVFFLLVSFTLIAKISFVFYRYSYFRKVRITYSKNERLGEYLTGIAYFNHGAAKEIRINQLNPWFLGKVKRYRNEMVQSQYVDFKRQAMFDILTTILVAFQSLIVLGMLSTRYLNNLISIADFTLYFTSVVSLTSTLSLLTENLGNYYQQVLNLTDLHHLLEYKTDDKYQWTQPLFIDDKSVEIVFNNVSFTYPNTSKRVLDHINLTIRDQEKICIVGFNGAGKSTFIKLICKFYRPTEGTITLNGIDIWDIPNEYYYKWIGVVFQDYVNFPFTIKENISMNNTMDMERVKQLNKETRLDQLINNLPKGYDTYIDKVFDSEGVELSGGQGQKLAISRALYKDTPILILDEPTANLDPKAEREIYEHLFRVAQHRTTLFISHRLASSTIADRIVVFKEGKIIENGSHRELLLKDGLYAEMYQKQSEAYSK